MYQAEVSIHMQFQRFGTKKSLVLNNFAYASIPSIIKKTNVKESVNLERNTTPTVLRTFIQKQV